VPEVGTSWALTRALGYRRAFAYYVSGEHIDARRALDLGLVNEVVPGGELMDAAMRWCDRVSALPPHALPIAKPLLHDPWVRRGHRERGGGDIERGGREARGLTSS
jgi:2-(1,2-epoxy-1,2-dihydrophenyl)acetyl-CoA isomerase